MKMRKLLLLTPAAITLLGLAGAASFAHAQFVTDTGLQIRSGVGGNFGVSIEGLTGEAKQRGVADTGSYYYGQDALITMPNFQNYLKVYADGNASNLGLTFGGVFKFRLLSGTGADAFDRNAVGAVLPNKKPYVKEGYIYVGQKWAGRLTLGKHYGVVAQTKIDGSDIVPGFSNAGEGILISGYRNAVIDPTDSDTAAKITYQTPAFYGFWLGYTFTPETDPSTFAAQKVKRSQKQVHEAAIRYDGRLGPVDVAANVSYRANDGYRNDLVNDGYYTQALTAGGQIGYTDNRTIGVKFAAGYRNINAPKSELQAGRNEQSWSAGLAFTSPYVQGATLGLLYAENYDRTNAQDAKVKTTRHVGVGLGYAWSENFTQTVSYDHTVQATVGGPDNVRDATGGAWIINSQVSF